MKKRFFGLMCIFVTFSANSMKMYVTDEHAKQEEIAPRLPKDLALPTENIPKEAEFSSLVPSQSSSSRSSSSTPHSMLAAQFGFVDVPLDDVYDAKKIAPKEKIGDALENNSALLLGKIFTQNPDLLINKDEMGWNILHKAVIGKKLNIINYLVKNTDIDVNEPDDEGLTPLLLAVKHESSKAVALLLQHPKIDVNCVDKDGLTPLHMAIKYDLKEVAAIIAHLLGDAKIRVNIVDKILGETPLQMAVSRKQELVVELLLNHKDIDTGIKNTSGVSVHDMASVDSKKIKQLLERHESYKEQKKDPSCCDGCCIIC